jgi:hypothetical protein
MYDLLIGCVLDRSLQGGYGEADYPRSRCPEEWLHYSFTRRIPRRMLKKIFN